MRANFSLIHETHTPPPHIPSLHIRVCGVQLTLFASPSLPCSPLTHSLSLSHLLIPSPTSSPPEPLKTRANNKALCVWVCMHGTFFYFYLKTFSHLFSFTLIIIIFFFWPWPKCLLLTCPTNFQSQRKTAVSIVDRFVLD